MKIGQVSNLQKQILFFWTNLTIWTVFWLPYGNWPSFRDIIDDGMADDIFTWSGKFLEKVHQLLLSTKHQQYVAILDCDGITFSKMFHELNNLTGEQLKILLVLWKFGTNTFHPQGSRQLSTSCRIWIEITPNFCTRQSSSMVSTRKYSSWCFFCKCY